MKPPTLEKVAATDAAASDRIRILLVEDDAVDAELAAEELRDGGIDFEMSTVDSEAAFRVALENFNPDLVLSDLSLPGFNGYKALEILREKSPGIPFILMSGTIGEDVAVESLRRGATDYILKNNMTRLASAVLRAVREAQEQAARERAERNLMRSQRYESLAMLAAGLSHDLRNVLQPLLITSSVIEERDDPELRQFGELVKDCAQRGLDMVSAMLSFARGAQTTRQTVCMSKLFESLALLLKGSLPRGVELHIVRSASDQTLEGNHTELQQCVLNLCLNALQAMPDGGELTLACDEVQVDESYAQNGETIHPGAHLRISVTDTGIGMNPEVQNNLFRPFYTTKSDGTGLGLISCKRILNNHSGFLRLTSAPGKGTRFDVYLPLEISHDVGKPIRSGHGERVFVTTELAGKLAMLTNILERHGYVVQSARSGADALMTMQNTELPEAVVMDADMSLMSGVRTLSELVDREYPGVVILLIRPRSPPDPDGLPPLKRIRFVNKPVVEEELIRAIREELDAAAAGTSGHDLELASEAG